MDYLCAYDDSPCWIPGTGYRIVTPECAIDDEVYDKFTSPTLVEVSQFSDGEMWVNPTKIVRATTLDEPTLAAVPLGSSGEFLLVALVIFVMSRMLMRFADLDESVRGPESGRV